MIEGYVAKLGSCETLNYIPMYLIRVKDIARYQHRLLFSERADTTNVCSLQKADTAHFLNEKVDRINFCNEQADITNFYNKKRGDYEFL